MIIESHWVAEFREQRETTRIMAARLRGGNVTVHVKEWPRESYGEPRVGSFCLHTPQQVKSFCDFIDELNAQPDFENGSMPIVHGCSAVTCVRIDGELVLVWGQQEWGRKETALAQWHLVHLTERRLAMLTRFVQMIREAAWSVTFVEPEEEWAEESDS